MAAPHWATPQALLNTLESGSFPEATMGVVFVAVSAYCRWMFAQDLSTSSAPGASDATVLKVAVTYEQVQAQIEAVLPPCAYCMAAAIAYSALLRVYRLVQAPSLGLISKVYTSTAACAC